MGDSCHIQIEFWRNWFPGSRVRREFRINGIWDAKPVRHRYRFLRLLQSLPTKIFLTDFLSSQLIEIQYDSSSTKYDISSLVSRSMVLSKRRSRSIRCVVALRFDQNEFFLQRCRKIDCLCRLSTRNTTRQLRNWDLIKRDQDQLRSGLIEIVICSCKYLAKIKNR